MMFLPALTNDLFFSTSLELLREFDDREGGFWSQLAWILKSPLAKKLILLWNCSIAFIPIEVDNLTGKLIGQLIMVVYNRSSYKLQACAYEFCRVLDNWHWENKRLFLWSVLCSQLSSLFFIFNKPLRLWILNRDAFWYLFSLKLLNSPEGSDWIEEGDRVFMREHMLLEF